MVLDEATEWLLNTYPGYVVQQAVDKNSLKR